MITYEPYIEIIGWIASLLIVGSYALNITGKLPASSKTYVLANIIGGVFFVVNTYYHQAYPSMFVNVIWVIIAIYMISKKKKNNNAKID
ncbi:MAG: hypothetical protein LW602_05320 [Sediminibacterium sp.]|nr:hypothetical protein [Sediminibacterium sp.]